MRAGLRFRRKDTQTRGRSKQLHLWDTVPAARLHSGRPGLGPCAHMQATVAPGAPSTAGHWERDGSTRELSDLAPTTQTHPSVGARLSGGLTKEAGAQFLEDFITFHGFLRFHMADI